MKRHITRLILSILSGCAMLACSSDNQYSNVVDAGVMSVDIVTDASVSVAGAQKGGTVNTGYDVALSDVVLTMTSYDGMYTHTWDNATEFVQGQYYLAGLYKLSGMSGILADEGFDKPVFKGYTEVEVSKSVQNTAVLTLTVANSLIKVSYDDDCQSSGVESVKAMFHTPGGMYHTYEVGETRYLCMAPGRLEIMLDVVMADGREVFFTPYVVEESEAAVLYEFTIKCAFDGEIPVVSISGCEGEKVTHLTDSFINAAAPVVTSTWPESTAVDLPEGNEPESMCRIDVTSNSQLASVRLSSLSASLVMQGLPSEIDLLAVSVEEAVKLQALGLISDMNHMGGNVNLDGLLANLIFFDESSALSSFTLTATDVDGRMSNPVTILVRTLPVEIEVKRVYPVTMGVNHAVMEVACDAAGFMKHVEVEVCDDAATDVWHKVAPLDVRPIGESLYSIAFDVADGSSPVKTRILYCSEVRSTVDVPRRMPQFTIEVDPYATMAAVKIVPADASLLKSITGQTRIYIDGNEAPIYIDLPEQGILTVIGLSPVTKYEFKATMMTGVESPEFTPAVTVVTEDVPQLPNYDFEERTDVMRYKDLPSGGRYSQTIVEIFNWQHFTTVDVEMPKRWANTNAKTFCFGSTNHNTWYMQPSVALTRANVFSQSFAVELTSVAFDPHGEPIPDYTQTGTPYLDYSPIVPEISYRAAGKLFLGDYAFDPATMQEAYYEGIEWYSRPSSLNGYYCYYPVSADRSDCGLVTVEVLGYDKDGEEIVIAFGMERLTLALSYTAFNVPLTYKYFGVKASRIKVMFSSSANTGTIAEESREVITVPNPVSATSTGGKLWIDNVTLAY